MNKTHHNKAAKIEPDSPTGKRMGADFPATDDDIHTSTIMTPPARAPKASARLLALLFPVLACIVLPQQAAAQNSATDVIVSIADASVGEGDDSVTLTARLSRTVSQAVMLGVTYQDDTATFADDLSGDPPAPRRITIPANNLSVDFTVFIRNDTIDEPDEETLTVSLGGSILPPGENFVFNGSHRATLTIIDDDDPPPPTTVSIADAQPILENAGSVNFRVTMSREVASDVVLGVAYGGGMNNPATPADDLVADRPTTVTIEEGETGATLSVPIANDAIVEGDETFTVTLGEDPDTPLPDNVSVTGSRATATGTITDNDAAEIALDPAMATAAEGATFSYTVSLGAAAEDGVTVRWTASAGPGDTATVADDLQETTGTVRFEPDTNVNQTFTIAVTEDDDVEIDETFTVTLSPDNDNPLPTGVTIGTDNSSAAMITDNDEVLPTVDIDIADARADEGDNIRFTVTLSDQLLEARTLNIGYTAGTGDSGAGLDDLGSARPTTLTLPTGTMIVNFDVPTVEDTDAETDEIDETFTVTLSLPDLPTDRMNRLNITDSTATGTIVDDDEPTGDVIISIADARVGEGDDSVTLTARFSRTVSQDVTLGITYQDGTATFVDDVSGDPSPPRMVTIPADSLSADFTVFIRNDTVGEPDEMLTVSLGGSDFPAGETFVFNGSHRATLTIIDNDGPVVVNARVSIDDETVVENVSGGTVTFTAALTTAVNSPVVLAVEVTADTATLGVDLGVDLPTTVTIDMGQTEATFTVPITDDNIVEGNETFTVTLSESATTALPEGVTIPSGTATGTITENDEAEVTLTANTATANENGGTFSYTVNLSNPADEAVIVRWTATDGTATVDDDLDEQTGTVTFDANSNTAQTFTIAVNDDDFDEDEENFTVTLEVDDDNPLPTGVSIGTSNTATGTITDNDDTPVVEATVSIDDESVVENVSGGTVTFTAALTTAVNSPVVLAVEVTAGTATLGVDLGVDLPTTVTIDQGQTEATFTVPITDDNIVEGNETFTVTLSESATTSLPEGVTIPNGTATGTINDNDEAEVTLTANTATANENGGTFSYTVNLSNPVDEAVIVRWTATDGTATVDDDLDEQTNTVTFVANSNTAQTFTISPTNDNEDEDNENFTVTLGVDTEGGNPLPTGVSIGTSNTATGTITDNDDTPVVEATVSIDDESVVENVSGGTVTFTAALTTAVNSPVVLAVEVTAGTATLGVDLGVDLPTTVTIDMGQTEATFTVPITDDNIVEGNETFTVTLSESDTTSLPEGVTIPNGTATGTINDNDEAEVTLTANTATANENGGTFSYTVNLSNPVDEAVIVRWTATDGTATVDDDLDEQTNTVTFVANSNTAQTFTISPTNDNEDEDNENFTVTLGVDTEGGNPLPTGVSIGTSNTATGTITDNDDTPVVTATVSIDDESVVENVSGGTVTFTAALTTAVNSPVVLAVEVTADTATLGVDLGTDLPTTVTIDMGQTEATFTVPITDDNIVEGNETFTVTLSESDTTSLPEGVTIPNGTATGTITENDEAEVTLTANTATANENGGTFSYTVNLSNPVDEAVIVRWTATDGTAIVATDLQATTNTVTFVANSNTAQTFTISPTNDNEDEDNETFTVTLGADGDNPLPTGVTIGTNNSSVATITDNDDTPVVEISIAAASATEGDTIRFTVTLSDELLAARTLNIGYTAGTGDSGAGLDDLGADRPTTLSLPPGTRNVNLDVPTVEDTDAETDETFTVTLSLPDPPDNPVNTLTITTATATGTIVDDDAPTEDVIVSIDDARVGEGDDSVTLTARFSRTVSQDVMLGITYQDGTATVADDLSGDPAPPRTVRIPANSLSADFTVFIRNDTVDEPDEETLTVSLGGASLPPETNFDFSNNSATLTIVDDDDPAPPVNNRVSIVDPQPISEGAGALNFVVSTQFAVNSDVVLGVAYAVGTTNPATPADDLGPDRSTTVTIAAGERRATLRVPITDDGIVEGNETFTVALSLPDDNPPGHTLFLDANEGEATGTINDNDAAEVTLGPATLRAAEDATFTYTVSLSAAADEAVTVRWTATAGPGDTATVADDLQAPHTGTVSFAANNAGNMTFTIQPVIDEDDEEDETFTVTLSENRDTPLPEGVTIGTDNTATGTITDNDEAPPTLPPPPGDDAMVDIRDSTVGEGEGNASFTVTLSEAVSSPVVLAVTYTDGSAEVATDLGMPLSTTVMIAADTLEATLEVPIIDDDLVEGEETFTVTLSEGTTPLPDGVTISNGTATGTITDNDRRRSGGGGPGPIFDPVRVSLSPLTPTVAEDVVGGSIAFTVSLNRAVNNDVVLGITYAGGTDNPVTLADDLGTLPTTVMISATTTEATFTVPITNDTLVEGDETFTVTLSEGTIPLPDGVTIRDGTATGTIEDDDEALVSLSPATATAIEDGEFSYTVSLSAAADEAVTVRWTATDGTAIVADDLQAPRTGTVTFAANNAGNMIFTIQPVIDGGDEEDETFTVTLTATDTLPLPTGVVIDTQNNRSVATIINNRPATVSIADADPVAEDAGPARFTVSLSEAVSSDVVLDVSYAARTAVLGDLGPDRPATVTLPANSLEATLEVPIFDDAIVEGAETFTVIVSESSGNPLPAGVSITDGEAMGTIALTAESSVLIEPRRTGAGTALRRHVNRFDSMTGSVVQHRLDGREMQRVSSSDNLGSGGVAIGGGLGKTDGTDDTGETPWGAWLNGAWTGFGGTASGRQADVYGGVDYLSEGWLIGGLLGYEVADLDIGEATYSANYTHVGVYGGVRLPGQLLFDGAATYGMATPNVALGNVSASYEARRITARGALTGDFGFEYGLKNGSVTIAPQLGLLYARERLGGFTDSAGGVAEREVLELGRFSAGPRLTWDFEGGQVVGGLRMQGDFLQLDDGAEGRISGAANIGIRLDLTPNATLGIQSDVDGLGITDDFRSYGGNIELDVRF